MAEIDFTKMILEVIHKVVKVVKKEILNTEEKEKKEDGKDTS